MSCNCEEGEVFCIYRGETVVFDFVLKGDDGEPVTNIDDVVVLITDIANKQVPVERHLGNGIEFDNGNLRFSLTPAESAVLPKRCGIEVKIIVNTIVRIATRKLMNVLDDKVKDY